MEGKTPLNNDCYLVNETTHDCYEKSCYEKSRKRKAWRRILILIILAYFVSRMLFGWLAFYTINETQETSFNLETESYTSSPFRLPELPIAPKCEPIIKWEGPSEVLIYQKNISGLIFKVGGLLPHGSVTIRQDSQAEDYINITNHIYLGDESLQEKVDIKISYIDEDYSVTVETPPFSFPPNKRNCVLVNTIITIPHTVSVFRTLSVNVPNSWITTDSLGIIDFAYVNLKTTNGHIRIDDLTAANADVSTVNGHINGDFVIGENLEARSINGPIHLKARPNPWSDNVSVSVSSFSGNLNIEVDDLLKHHKIDLKGRTVNGGIVATVPKSYKGDFSVSSITGYAYVEGQGIIFRKDTHNVKEGYKKKHKCEDINSLYDLNNSNLTLSVVTGASELYFV